MENRQYPVDTHYRYRIIGGYAGLVFKQQGYHQLYNTVWYIMLDSEQETYYQHQGDILS